MDCINVVARGTTLIMPSKL